VLKHLTLIYPVSAKVRIKAKATNGNVPIQFPIYLGFTNEEVDRNVAQSSTVLSTTLTETGIWTEIKNIPVSKLSNFYSGYGVIRVECDLFDGTVTVDIKDIVLTINDKDKNAIDTALSSAGSSWTFDKLVAEKTEEDDKEDEKVYTDYPIYQANPLKAGEIGADATVSIVDEASRNPVYTAKENEDIYFTYTDKYATSGQSQWNRRHYFNMGYNTSNSGYEWMGDDKVLESLAGYFTASVKIRIKAEATNGTAPTEFPIYLGFTNEYADRSVAHNSTVLNATLTETGVWTEIKNIPVSKLANFYSGYGVIRVECELFDGTVTADIKDIVLTINDKDKNAIDTALSSAGSEWTFDKLVAEKTEEDDKEDDKEDEEVYTDYPVYQDNPLRAGEIGADATASIADEASRNPVYTAKENEDIYFTYTDKYSTSGQSEWNRRHYFNMGYKSANKGYEWIGDDKILEKLAGYITVSAKVRVTANAENGNVPTEFPIYFGLTNEEADRNVAHNSTVLNATLTQTGVWKEIKNIPVSKLANFYSGYGVIRVECGLFDGTLTVDIKDIVLTINDKDKEKINSALSEAGSSWNFDKLTAVKNDADLIEPEVLKKDTYVIWDANTDTILADKQGKVNASFEEGYGKAKYDVYKKSDKAGSYYSAEFSESGKGDLNNYAAAEGNINDKTLNFGWLSNKEVLNALTPYLYIGFEYKVGSTKPLPKDTVLTLNAAEPYFPDLITLAKVNVSDAENWSTYKLSRLVDTKFIDIWYSGSLTYSLTSVSGGLDGTQTVDIKNIVLVLKESDKEEINEVLKSIKGINKISNFTKENTKKSMDYYSILTSYDKQTALSGRDYKGTNKLSISYVKNTDIAVSKTNAQTGEYITVYTSTAMNYNIAKIIVTTKNGENIAVKTVIRNSEFSFKMPSDDVVVTADVVYEEERELAFLWKSFPGTLEYKPWYLGVDERQYEMSLIDGGTQSAYKLDITDNKGCITIHGEKNVSITLDRYFDTAYLYTSIKLDKNVTNRKIKIGISEEMIYEVTIPKTDEYTTVKIPLKKIATSASVEYFRIYLDNRKVGESIYVGESFVFSKEINGTVDDAWAKILDMSGYKKSKTNKLLGKIGDTEGVLNPWCENMDIIGDSVVNWDLAWYYSFQNMAPYIMIPNEDLMGKEYFTTFYGDTIDITEYVDTGYLEFYIYCDTDGIELPLSVEASGHEPRTFATFKVKYDKSKAREDGYMQVRIPFTYFADSGLNLDEICRVTLKGTQSSLYCDYFLLSSFRFYSNLADVPDPEPIVEPEPEPERDLPLEIDSKILNAKLDKENLILYVPENTKIWEILSALVFDTNETHVDFYNGNFIEDDETVVTEEMSMVVYRRGYTLATFGIKLLVDENAVWDSDQNSEQNEENDYLPDINTPQVDEEVSDDDNSSTDEEIITDDNQVSDDNSQSNVKPSNNSKNSVSKNNNRIIIWIVCIACAVSAGIVITVILIIKNKKKINRGK